MRLRSVSGDQSGLKLGSTARRPGRACPRPSRASRPRGRVDRGRDLVQGERGERVVVVQEGDELAGREGQRGIRVAGDAAVLGQVLYLNPLIFCPEPVEYRPHVRGSAGIGETEFPVRVGLGQDRFDHPGQVHLRRVVNGNHDADRRRAAEHLRPLPRQVGRSRFPFLPPTQVLLRRGTLREEPFLGRRTVRFLPSLQQECGQGEDDLYRPLEDRPPAGIKRQRPVEDAVDEVGRAGTFSPTGYRLSRPASAPASRCVASARLELVDPPAGGGQCGFGVGHRRSSLTRDFGRILYHRRRKRGKAG